MKPSVDGSSSASENHAPEIRLTRITAQRPARLSKSFQMVGNVLTKKSGGDMVDGVAERLTVNTVAEFAALLPTLTPKQAISYAVNGHDVARVVTADYLDKARAQGGDLPIIARTRDHFAWPDGPGILMVDYDAPEPGAPLDKAELRAALTAACPALADAPAVWRPSASSCIYTAEGAELRGIAGQRFYFAVLAAQDIPRAGQVLFDRLWLAGFGRYELSKSGAFLIRSVMDASVFQPERLDFCGGAATAKGLVQRLPEPALFNPDAPYLDTRAALPDLTADERQRLTELREALKGPLRERQREIRSAWIDARVAAGLARLPVAEHEQARPALERTYRQAAEGGRLDAGFELIVVVKGGKARKTLTVGEILRNRAQYHEAKTLDPLEPDYPQGQARLVGWLNLNARPPYLKSQAHGGTRYDLGAEACADAPELDEGYWESMFNDSLSREKVSNNPSHSSHSSQSITYTFLTRHQPVPPVPFTLSAPELTTFDEKGRTVVLVDSKGAAAVAVALTGRLAFCRFTLTWYGFTDTYWQPLAGSIADGLITRLIYAGSTECGFEARYATAVTSLLRKGLLPLPDTAAGNSRLLPFANGLLDPVTRNLTAITPDNALTWSLPYPYDPSADCPALRAWLKQAVDDDVERWNFCGRGWRRC
jgi:hypothetical protein